MIFSVAFNLKCEEPIKYLEQIVWGKWYGKMLFNAHSEAEEVFLTIIEGNDTCNKIKSGIANVNSIIVKAIFMPFLIPQPKSCPNLEFFLIQIFPY